MDPEPIVFDISSDDESSGCRDEPRGPDFDWLAEFLGIADDGDQPSGEDSDEVVILREVKSTAKSKPSKPPARDKDEDDDDCVVLDGDPDKPAAIDEDSNSSGGSGDLLIVGEKGQIACRDFPHSRHLCARFPFSSTPHEKHCNLCHCYVCDSPAPCALWATSNFGFAHCHATDKEELWKAQRRNLKSGKPALLPASKLNETPRPVGLPQDSPLNIVRLSHNLRLHNQVSRPATVQACSSTNPKNRFQPRIVSGGHSHGVNHNIRRGKGGQPIGNSGPSLLRPLPTTFKRPGSVGVSVPTGQTTFSSSNSRNCAGAGQYARTPTPTPALNNLNAIRWANVNSIAPQSSSEPNLGTIGALSTPTSQQQLYIQPIPPSTDRQNFHQHANQLKSNGQSMYQYGNQTQNSGQAPDPGGIQSASAKAASSLDYNPSWVLNACQSDQQQPPPVEHSQLQGTQPSNEPLVESNSHFSVGDSNLCSDFAFDDWLLDDPSVPMFSDGSCLPPQLNNIFSPEPAHIDAGMLLLDYETSWNGLTHA